MGKLMLELEPSEALMILGPIQDHAADASTNAARWTGDEQEIASLTAKILGRVALRITDLLYPPCAWLDEDRCERPVVERGYCAFHLARLQRPPVFA